MIETLSHFITFTIFVIVVNNIRGTVRVKHQIKRATAFDCNLYKSICMLCITAHYCKILEAKFRQELLAVSCKRNQSTPISTVTPSCISHSFASFDKPQKQIPPCSGHTTCRQATHQRYLVTNSAVVVFAILIVPCIRIDYRGSCYQTGELRNVDFKDKLYQAANWQLGSRRICLNRPEGSCLFFQGS